MAFPKIIVTTHVCLSRLRKNLSLSSSCVQDHPLTNQNPSKVLEKTMFSYKGQRDERGRGRGRDHDSGRDRTRSRTRRRRRRRRRRRSRSPARKRGRSHSRSRSPTRRCTYDRRRRRGEVERESRRNRHLGRSGEDAREDSTSVSLQEARETEISSIIPQGIGGVAQLVRLIVEYDFEPRQWDEIEAKNVNCPNKICSWKKKLYAFGYRKISCLDLQSMRVVPNAIPNITYWERDCYEVCSYNDRLFVVGGAHIDARHILRCVECLDLRNVGAGWKALPDMSVERRAHAVCCCDDKLFAVGGWSEAGVEKRVEFLDLKNVDQGWRAAPDMSTTRTDLSVCCHNDKLYATGGRSQSCDRFGALNSVECLDLKNMSAGWKALPEMLVARRFLSLCCVNGYLYAVGDGRYWGPPKYQDCDEKTSVEYLDLENVREGWKEGPKLSLCGGSRVVGLCNDNGRALYAAYVGRDQGYIVGGEEVCNDFGFKRLDLVLPQ